MRWRRSSTGARPCRRSRSTCPPPASAAAGLVGSRFFDWIEAGKKVYTDTSWAIGFAPRWMAAEIERRGVGADRLLFASDEPWGDRTGELARMAAACGDGELGRAVFAGNAAALYG